MRAFCYARVTVYAKQRAWCARQLRVSSVFWRLTVAADKTLAELATQFDVHPTRITQWKARLLERASSVFEGGARPMEPPVDLKTLHAKIGALALENDFLEGALSKPGMRSARR